MPEAAGPGSHPSPRFPCRGHLAWVVTGGLRPISSGSGCGTMTWLGETCSSDPADPGCGTRMPMAGGRGAESGHWGRLRPEPERSVTSWGNRKYSTAC